MYPIAFCSVLALGIFLERLWNLREKKIIPKDYLIEVEDTSKIRRSKIVHTFLFTLPFSQCNRFSTFCASFFIDLL